MKIARISGATVAICQAVATAADLPIDSISPDEDLVDDLQLNELERESLGLIIEEVFGVVIIDELWDSPLYRTPASLAEWVIRQAELQANIEAKRQRKCA